jgi:three-Cys-motif partner protein
MSDKLVEAVGEWTEVKLQIIREYTQAYAKILANQPYLNHFAYIDGFAGSGTHISKTTGDKIYGSPAIALETKPAFTHYYFIDMDGTKAARLRSLSEGRKDVTVYEEDCSTVLLQRIFPKYGYETYRRALCLLDPYDLNPNWEVIKMAAGLRTIEIFLNFMISDANRNVFWINSKNVPESQIRRMNAFWGDDSWKTIAYEKTKGLFELMEEKATNETVARAYQKRLIEVAGFKYVPDPIAMKNSKGSTLYYLFFASHNETGARIANQILSTYRTRGISYGS